MLNAKILARAGETFNLPKRWHQCGISLKKVQEQAAEQRVGLPPSLPACSISIHHPSHISTSLHQNTLLGWLHMDTRSTVPPSLMSHAFPFISPWRGWRACLRSFVRAVEQPPLANASREPQSKGWSWVKGADLFDNSTMSRAFPLGGLGCNGYLSLSQHVRHVLILAHPVRPPILFVHAHASWL